MANLNTASRMLGVIDQQIAKATKSGAGVEITYGQIFGIDNGYKDDVLTKGGAIGVQGAVGYWRLNELSGTIAADQLGLNPGTYINAPTFGVPGPLVNDFSTAVQFNGTNEYVSVPNTTGALTQYGDFTIVAWIKRNTTGGTHGIFSGGTGAFYLFIDANNQIQLARENISANVAVSTATITDANWHMVVLTRLLSFEMHIYLDGIDVTGVTNTTVAFDAPTSPLTIGATTGGFTHFFNGSMAEITLYGGALTEIEVASLYESRSEVAGSASVYIAGSRELAASDGGIPEPSRGFRVPSFLDVKTNDFVRVNMDDRGHRWIDDLMPKTNFPQVALQPNNGALVFGTGLAPFDTSMYRWAAGEVGAQKSFVLLGTAGANPNTGAEIEVASHKYYNQYFYPLAKISVTQPATRYVDSADFVIYVGHAGLDERLRIKGDTHEAVFRGTVTGDAVYSGSTIISATDMTAGGIFRHLGASVGFFNHTATAKQTVTGSRGGNAALASLLTALDLYGFITNSSTA